MNIRAHIHRVIDGDTVWVRIRVRLATRSSPELVTREGSIAHERLQHELPLGAPVQLVKVQGVDEYGRIVADLVADRSGL